jgi:hypothetical protein
VDCHTAKANHFISSSRAVIVIRHSAKLLSDGGPTMWLQAAFEKMMAKKPTG